MNLPEGTKMRPIIFRVVVGRSRSVDGCGFVCAIGLEWSRPVTTNDPACRVSLSIVIGVARRPKPLVIAVWRWLRMRPRTSQPKPSAATEARRIQGFNRIQTSFLRLRLQKDTATIYRSISHLTRISTYPHIPGGHLSNSTRHNHGYHTSAGYRKQ
jgi:hypothetical protein